MEALGLRICLVNGTYAPMVGGAERQMQQQARLLRSRGHEVRVITYGVERAWPRHELIEGVAVTRTGGLYLNGKLRRRWGLAVAPVLWALWRQRHLYDLIQAQQTLELGYAAVVMGRLLGKPVVTRMASTGMTNDLRLLEQHDGVIGWWMARRIRRSQSTFVVLASNGISEMRTQGIAADRLHWIPSGVDISRYSSASRRVGGAPRQVITVGHLEYIKGIDVLLRAWRTVLQNVPDAHLLIVGDGSQREVLGSLVNELDLGGSITFAGQSSEVPRHLSEAEMFVLPSRTEGLPNALLEAMASGLPCVATRVGACGDVIQDGVSGLLVEPEDAPALARALITLMRDPALADVCALGGRALVEQRYSAQGMVEQYEQLYLEVMLRQAGHHARQAHLSA